MAAFKQVRKLQLPKGKAKAKTKPKSKAAPKASPKQKAAASAKKAPKAKLKEKPGKGGGKRQKTVYGRAKADYFAMPLGCHQILKQVMRCPHMQLKLVYPTAEADGDLWPHAEGGQGILVESFLREGGRHHGILRLRAEPQTLQMI